MSIQNESLKLKKNRDFWLHLLLLLLWIAIGAGLRFTHLASKNPSTIELATLIFSLGNSVQTVPVEQAITLDKLLQPLQPAPILGIREVIHNLMTESTHPPIYFALSHWWLKLFPANDGLVSLWAGRALSALFGVVSIPAMFGFGWLAFRSRLVGQIAAAMMAVSPYGIYLAQEARHYTLTILLIIASLCCLVVATRIIQNKIVLPAPIVLIWVVVNSLGIAVHYFFVLTLAAEALVLLKFWLADWQFAKKKSEGENSPSPFLSKSWWRIYGTAAGTLIGCLVWLPALKGASDSELTKWIYEGNPLSDFFAPIARLVAWLITMLSLLPVEGQSLPITVASSLLLGIFILWAVTIFIRGTRRQMQQPAIRLSLQVLGGFILAAIFIILCVTYIVGADVTLAARYHFFYFPAVIVFLAASLAVYWDHSPTEGRGIGTFSLIPFSFMGGKKTVSIILLMGLIGSLTVVSNLGFQKSKRADLLVPIIQQTSQVPVLIAMVHKTHAETRALMVLALEFKRNKGLLKTAKNSPQFLLTHKDDDSQPATDTLSRTLSQMPRPLDLWAVNFNAPIGAESQNCVLDSKSKPKVTGYKYRLYHCL
ncbi:glycosyltransferase family 39 protein [Microcoleus sp. FACHB-672]|uniref:glycosyltransferase family 39 protein n=1 Tax=Microcoleus sp. FACHB-672 TaxID=2692825 RepID=UPI001686EA35|nr:hypothetical protein [Microcoleus sp. FACHB-672]MBD2039856.1 hypothetical protein [Microcoleus sp. FACHB-672]